MIHIANTQVEFEYAASSSLGLEQDLSRYPLCLQLQFLPLLYAPPNDVVAVTTLPPSDYLACLQQTSGWLHGTAQLIPMKATTPFQGTHCVSWGPSQAVLAWAQERNVHYTLPQDWDMIRLVNSKAFSFRYTTLKEASLLTNEQDLLRWLEKIEGPKVLKTCFGLSGRGHRQIRQSSLAPDVLAFCQQEWKEERPLIGEPWLNRVGDFSSQWFIHTEEKIEKIGVTWFETDARGGYQATVAGPEERLFAQWKDFLFQHLEFVQRPLQDMAKMGFFGFIGIDALLYHDERTDRVDLYPIVEINARQTLSLVALRIQQRLCPDKLLRLAFQSTKNGGHSLLPIRLVTSQGKEIRFHKQLTMNIL